MLVNQTCLYLGIPRAFLEVDSSENHGRTLRLFDGNGPFIDGDNDDLPFQNGDVA